MNHTEALANHVSAALSRGAAMAGNLHLGPNQQNCCSSSCLLCEFDLDCGEVVAATSRILGRFSSRKLCYTHKLDVTFRPRFGFFPRQTLSGSADPAPDRSVHSRVWSQRHIAGSYWRLCL